MWWWHIFFLYVTTVLNTKHALMNFVFNINTQLKSLYKIIFLSRIPDKWIFNVYRPCGDKIIFHLVVCVIQLQRVSQIICNRLKHINIIIKKIKFSNAYFWILIKSIACNYTSIRYLFIKIYYQLWKTCYKH